MFLITLVLLLLVASNGFVATFHGNFQQLLYVPKQKTGRSCTSLKFHLSESQDIEDRGIMKYARTSFFPSDTSFQSVNCVENFHLDQNLNNSAIAEDAQNFHKRLRRTSQDVTDSSKNNANVDEQEADLDYDDEDFNSIQSTIQSFWNERGTKETIRSAQAKRMLSYIDNKVDPCEDFYKYACGNWERLHRIPKDKAGYDTFEMLRENLDIILKQLLETKDPIDPVCQDQSNKIFELSPINKNELKSATTEFNETEIYNINLNKRSTVKFRKDVIEEKSKVLRESIIRRRHLLRKLLIRYRRQTAANFKKRCDQDEKKSQKISAKQKARYLYESCVNTKLLAKRGVKPLLHLIDSLGGWPVLDSTWNEKQFDWLNLTAQLRRYNNDILIVEWVGPDIKNSDENIIQFDQTTLGLPSREYFLQSINKNYLKAYQRFMCEVMEELGASKDIALRASHDLIDFETQLASITSPAEQRQNVTKLYKRLTINELHNEIPEINWTLYLTILQDRDIKDSEQVVIYAADYMKNLVTLIKKTDADILANYLMWRFIRHRINNVDDRFEDSKQNFYHELFGREESPSRWKICIAQVNTNMGMALGAMFVSKYFDENSKEDTLKMTHELQQAFREILLTTNWLDTTTKHLAEAKVNAMSLKIGYPDFILNPAELDEKYAGFEIDPNKYFENTLNVLLHISKTEQNKINERVNKTNWQTAPAIVNAYYSRNKNQIMFPAGILQPPFYHRYFPKALNFGGIGVVIGHELTHGFDDKGRLFDLKGSIHKWWTDESIKGFDQRARCIIEQYSNYTVDEVGIAVNGESTQGENIADNGGIRQAFHAYKNWQNDNPFYVEDERMPGINMTGAQLFFLNFGQVWCGAMRPEAVRNKLNTAIHSPGRFRVIGTLSNSEDFSREFHCAPGSPMNPVHKCSVW